jgi:RecA/RadA recombinase
MLKKICKNCGTSFEAQRSTALFHSDVCRAAFAKRPVKSLGSYNAEEELAKFVKNSLEEVTWITTGIPEFDGLTQIPRGRITQIQGPYAVGKTTLALNMLRGLADKKVLYIDTEAALNPKRMTELELRSDNFVVYNDSAFIEDVYDVIVDAVSEPTYDIIILDSLAATTFRTEAAGEAADANIGQKAKVIGKLMRIIPMMLKKTRTALVIINQEREVIGSYAPIKYTPGGMGVPYAASLMVSLKTTKGARFPKSGPPFKGHTVTAEIIKSKVNEPWRKAEFKLYYGGQQ